MIQFLKIIFFHLSPLVFYTVSGRSMYPTFLHGKRVLVLKKLGLHNYKKGDVIVFLDKKSKLYFLKRIHKIEKNKVFVLGDNPKESSDSRKFGWIEIKDTIGKVIYS